MAHRLSGCGRIVSGIRRQCSIWDCKINEIFCSTDASFFKLSLAQAQPQIAQRLPLAVSLFLEYAPGSLAESSATL